MITSLQIRKIHVLKNILGLDDKSYRAKLRSFGVCSSKNLTQAEAEIFIDILEQNIASMRMRFEDLQGRDAEMASPIQLRKLEALWVELYKTRETLRTFLQKHFSVSDIKFLTKTRARKIIGILEKTRLKRVLKAV